MTTKTHWLDVPMYWLENGEALADGERIKALTEYRVTGGIFGVVLAEPDGSESAEDCERVMAAGPAPEEIDWSGFLAHLWDAGDASQDDMDDDWNADDAYADAAEEES